MKKQKLKIECPNCSNKIVFEEPKSPIQHVKEFDGHIISEVEYTQKTNLYCNECSAHVVYIEN